MTGKSAETDETDESTAPSVASRENIISLILFMPLTHFSHDDTFTADVTHAVTKLRSEIMIPP